MMPSAASNLAERERVADAAHLAGYGYIAIIGLGLFAEIVVRTGLIERNDPVATTNAISADAGLWRLGVLADLVMVICDVLVAGLLYLVLRAVHPLWAGIAATFRLVHAAVLAAGVVALVVPALLLDGELGPADLGDTAPAVYIATEVHRYAYLVALVFFAVHLAIVAVLLHRCSYLPTWLGWLTAAAAAGYLFDSVTFLLIGGYDGALSAVALAPAVLGEVTFAGWLVTRGIHRDGWVLSTTLEGLASTGDDSVGSAALELSAPSSRRSAH